MNGVLSWVARYGALGALLLPVAAVATACGGKLDLNFVGVPDDNTEGGAGHMIDASCGNRKVDTGETCDDGARADGDGCDGSCQTEEGWTCTGAPSVCVKCGNNKLEAGEDCDDGNTDAGDGCNAECKIEGSCETPLPIMLTAKADGFTGMASLSTAAGEAGQVEAATCAGAKVGGGPDRIFSFELPSPADVDISVGAGFDAIVRVTTKACDLGTELAADGCVDGAAVAGTETAHFDDMAAGTYYIVVDGKTAKQSGDFSVEIETHCPLSGVKIDRIIMQDPFRTVLLNTNQQCAVDLSRLGYYAQPEAADVPKTLPANSLKPLERRLLTSASPPPANTTYQGNIRFDLEDYAGAIYLCRGACDTANGENVIDAVRWNGASGELSVDPPSAVKFDANVATITDRDKMSYWRILGDSKFPNFSAKDWAGAYFVETFEDGTLGGWSEPTALFYKPKFEKVDGTAGAFSLSLVGGNATDTVWNGPIHTFRDNGGMPSPLAPTYVSLRVRAADTKAEAGYAFFGNAPKGKEASGFGSFFRDTSAIGFDLPPTAQTTYKANTWYTIEYTDFVYNGASSKVAVSVNGTSVKKDLAVGALTMSQLALRSVTPDSTFWIDQIIVQ